MSISVFTAGYEDRDINEFISRLRKNKIQILIDVREIPSSRKPGFSKKPLMEHLNSVSIKYMHLPELGSPKALRDKLHKDGDYDYFFENYRKYIKTRMTIVKGLYNDVISSELSCIMCFERHPRYCHRTIVAEKIKEIDGNGLTVTHI